MSRLVYFYTSLRNGQPTPWDVNRPTDNSSVKGFETEGFWYLWKTLIELKVIDEVLVVVESAVETGSRKWNDQFKAIVISHISQVLPLLRPDDILFVRGGFRSWFEFLKSIADAKRWVLFYRAASNRLKWPFWDIVLEDLTDKSYEQPIHKRLHYHFNKPIHPDIFKFQNTKRDIDVMFHASHIHDKKGQWKCVDALIAYQKMYGKPFVAAMPGGSYGGGRTREMYEKISRTGVKVFMPGMIQRRDLCQLMNRTKLYLHLGGAGQNDRGNLESMLCGAQQIIGTPDCHPPFVYNDPRISWVTMDHSPQKVAEIIHIRLEQWADTIPDFVNNYYEVYNDMHVAVKQMTLLFDFIKRHPIPDRTAAMKEFIT